MANGLRNPVERRCVQPDDGRFVNMASSASDTEHTYPSVIELNVGGQHFTTTLLTLTKQRHTMLGAMFSGLHRQPTDGHGRYFIDADATAFACILRYLRDGQLPASDMAESVYHAALYFGLQDLASELQFTPTIMAQQIKEKYHAFLGSFDEALKKVLNATLNARCVVLNGKGNTLWPKTRVVVAVHHKDRLPYRINPLHTCAWHKASGDRWVFAEESLGPIANSHVSELEYMEAIADELVSKGFVVHLEELGKCDAGHEEVVLDSVDVQEPCFSRLYTLLFHWKK